MKLSIVQFTPVFGDKSQNFQRMQALVKDLKSDIIVFPELCTTGYFFQSKEESAACAEPANGETAAFFKQMAEEHDAMIVAGFVERHGTNIYNSAMILAPEMETRIYRKTHLFYKERFCFDEGNTGFFVVPHHKHDARIGTMICYDWRFPESARALGLKGADVIVCPSNLVTNVWHIAMPARALENKVYVAVPNRAGTERRGVSASGEPEEVKFTGHSVIYGYNGAELAKAGAEADEVLTVEIEPANTRDKSFNPLNDIFRDRRPDVYAL
jgi:predicted amidohydrolase